MIQLASAESLSSSASLDNTDGENAATLSTIALAISSSQQQQQQQQQHQHQHYRHRYIRRSSDFKDRYKRLSAKRDMKFLHQIARFCASTSLHGVNRVFDGRGSACSTCQLVWLGIVCAATLGLCLHIAQEVSHYLAYPLSSSSRLSLNSFAFPDLTLCDPESPIRTRSVNVSLMGAANDKIQNLTGIWADGANRPMYRYEHYYNFSEMAARPVDSIVHCRFNDAGCSWRNFSVFFDRSYGNCFTFKPAARRLKRADIGFGLTLLLYHPSADIALEKRQIVGKMGYKMRTKEMAFQGEGVLVTIHPKDTIPHPQENANMAPLGMVTLIALHQETATIQSTPAQPCLPPRTIRMYDSLLRRHLDYASTQYDCANWIDKLHIVRECGCVPEGLVDIDYFPNPEEVPYCHNVTRGPVDNETEFLDTIQPLNDSTDGLEAYLLSRHPRIHRQLRSFTCYHNYAFAFNATCHESCETATYSAKISTAHWPHRAAESGDDHLKQILELSAIMQDYVDSEVSSGNLLTLSLAENNLTLRDCHQALSHIQLDVPELRELPETQSAIASCLRVHRFVRENFLLIRVYPQTLTVKHLRIETSFQLPQLLSSIGGCLGLWIGISLVTMFEFLEVLLILISYCVTRCIGRFDWSTVSKRGGWHLHHRSVYSRVNGGIVRISGATAASEEVQETATELFGLL